MSENQTNHRAAFLTYKNYLVSFSYFLNRLYPDYSTLEIQLKHLQRGEVADVDRVKKLLFNAWNTELLLNLPASFNRDLLRLSNHWSPVQAYYAVYLALRALIVAKMPQARGDHATTLKTVAINLIRDQDLMPHPLNILRVKKGFQPEHACGSVNPLESPSAHDAEKQLGSFKMFLDTTWNRAIEERCEDWKKVNVLKNGKQRRRLPNGMKTEITERQRPISVFDCLYRIRLRSNYKDADIFLLGSRMDEVQEYFTSLCSITDKCLYCLEHYLEQALGKQEYQAMVGAFATAGNAMLLGKTPFNVLRRLSGDVSASVAVSRQTIAAKHANIMQVGSSEFTSKAL